MRRLITCFFVVFVLSLVESLSLTDQSIHRIDAERPVLREGVFSQEALELRPVEFPSNADAHLQEKEREVRLTGKATPPPYFTPQLRERVAEAQRVFGLTDSDAVYLLQMAAQQAHLGEQTGSNQLTIRTAQMPDGNFRLTADLSPEEQTNLQGVSNYEDIEKNPANNPHRVVLTINSLNGGLGENVGRRQWLAKTLTEITGKIYSADEVQLGAKGTDLGLFIAYKKHRVFISLAELQLLSVLKKMQDHPGLLAGVIYEPLVSRDSSPSFETLFDHTYYLDDRVSGAPSPRTYREMAKEIGLVLPEPGAIPLQRALPGLEHLDNTPASEARITLNPNGYTQPGGHGQWAIYFMLDALHHAMPQDGKLYFRLFINGDNTNAQMHEYLPEEMRREGVLVAQLNAEATNADKKGGKPGVRLTSDGRWVPDIMELAQAKAADKRLGNKGKQQERYFYNAGLTGIRKQSFNTNGFEMDRDKLHDVLIDLRDTVGEDEFLRIISPTLVVKPEKSKNGAKYIPIDGTIASVMHNVNAWFMTDPRGKKILSDHGLKRFLAYVTISRDAFAPIKLTWDFYEQAYTDYFKPDLKNFRLADARPGLERPEVEIVDLNEKGEDTGKWSEAQTMIEHLGHLRIQQLRSLYINGLVKLHNSGPKKGGDAELRGTVRIINRSGRDQDLTNPSRRKILKTLGLWMNNHLVLEDVEIIIHPNGLEFSRLSPSVPSAPAPKNPQVGASA